MGLDDLRALHPWPDAKPDVPANPHGWCLPEHRDLLAPRVRDARVILELGSWLGQSTRLLLGLAPGATVICVDHWRGSSDMVGNAEAEAILPTLYETFLVNQWPWKDRVIPVRADTLDGMRMVYGAGVRPDLVFLDAEHVTERVAVELDLLRTLFPKALLHGDDWGWPSVRAAVEPFAARHGLRVEGVGNAWALHED